ncbi:MAG: glycosyltransferase family 4 protein [Coriobacteriia bacterium]|nr:glycosyltransferase family 4 protein [Coriobacteriia bacterium]
MKVLEVSGRAAGGMGTHVRLLCELLADAGVKVTLAQPETNTSIGRADIPEVALAISSRPTPGDQKTISTLKELTAGYDAVQAHGLRAGALAALALRKITPRGRPRLIVTLHNQISGSGSTRLIGNYLLTTICKNADIVLGVSPDLVGEAKRRGARNVALALIAAQEAPTTDKDRDTIRHDLHIDTPLCFVTLARLAPQKGLNILIKAAQQMELSDYTWLIAGVGPLRAELETAAQGLPIRFLGHYREIGELLLAADAVVSTSIWEGQPVALQEALRAGCPIIATDVGGTAAVTGEAALLVEPNPASIAAALDKFSQDADLRTQLHNAALRRAQELPTPAQMLTQVLEALSGRQNGGTEG